jgi:hypothetical protein
VLKRFSSFPSAQAAYWGHLSLSLSESLCTTEMLCENIFKSVRSILCTEQWDIPYPWAAFLVVLLGLLWITIQSVAIADTCLLHTPYLFKIFKQLKFLAGAQWVKKIV